MLSSREKLLIGIEELELDLIDACNLACPLCNRSKFTSKTGYLKLDDWIKIINKYTNLKKIYFIGTSSEHTLYPHFLDICIYLKKRGIKIILSTNGCTKTGGWWKKLSTILDGDDEVRFAIDGITQKKYEIYRIGGNLERVLANHKCFKSETKNDVLQYIEFHHNRYEDVSAFEKKFSKTRIINSSQSDIEIKPREEYIKKYKTLNMAVKSRINKKITCETKNKLLFINNKGEVSPCCHYNENKILNGGSWDGTYTDIENGDNNFCTIICVKMCKSLRKDMNIEL